MTAFFRVFPLPNGRFVAQTKTLKGWVDLSSSKPTEEDAEFDLNCHLDEEEEDEE